MLTFTVLVQDKICFAIDAMLEEVAENEKVFAAIGYLRGHSLHASRDILGLSFER